MNLKQEVRAAWVAQEIKRLWPGAAQRRPKAEAKRAFKTERPPKEQSSKLRAPPGDTRPPAG